jgi:serine/threonine protein kinase
MSLECELLDALSASQHVIDCYGYGYIGTQGGRKLYCLLLELAELGTLDDLVRPKGVPKGLGPEAAHPLMVGILRGLSAVHNKARAIHRDIKSTNIVLTGEAAAPKVKLIDFGCAHYMGNYLDDLSDKWDVGTPQFAAPEQREGFLHDVRIDSYQLGLTFVQLRFGEGVPFPHLWRQYTAEMVPLSKEQQEQRRQDLVEELSRDDCVYTHDWADGRVKLTPAELDFLKRCLEPDVRRRDTVLRLIRHPYNLEGPGAAV